MISQQRDSTVPHTNMRTNQAGQSIGQTLTLTQSAR